MLWEAPNRVASPRAVRRRRTLLQVSTDQMRLRDSTQSLRRREAAPPSLVEPRAVPQAFAELSHDLRQPLTTIRMNLQSAIRLLQGPNPRVEDAVEALADCL